MAAVAVRALFRIQLDGRPNLARTPAIYCFSHPSWIDPFILMTALPLRPRLYFFGPKEEDMTVGGRNRLMHWTGSAVSFKPGKNDLLETTRRVATVLESGGVLAIAGEGRIHARERDILPLEDGPAYFALRSEVPLIPIAITGNSWLHFRGRIRVHVGEPFAVTGKPTKEAIVELTGQLHATLRAMVRNVPEAVPSRGLFARFTELFNDWGSGTPEAEERARQRAGTGRRAQQG
jgi:1-acyl-sn-glycerol-3-phosphate acyltransferase